MKKLILFLFVVFSVPIYADDLPEVVYRAVMDTPEIVKRMDGFSPRGSDGTRPNQPPADISLFNHVQGAATGLARHDSGYVSTTTSLNLAHHWVNQMLTGNGYIYFIRPTGNFVDVNGTLRQYSPHSDEFEYASLGVIRWNQIMGWRRVNFGRMGAFVPNRNYSRRIYSLARAGGIEPQLAGFPMDHRAWEQEPWRNFASCSSPRQNDREKCIPTFDSQEAGEYYFNNYVKRLTNSLIVMFLYQFPKESTFASQANNCPNCVSLKGQKVKLKDVGLVDGKYHYCVTTDNKKVYLPVEAVHKAELALEFGFSFYINTETNNFSLLND